MKRKIKKFRTRIKLDEFKDWYYPQIKGWFFWNYIGGSGGYRFLQWSKNGARRSHDINLGRNDIENYIREKCSPKKEEIKMEEEKRKDVIEESIMTFDCNAGTFINDGEEDERV